MLGKTGDISHLLIHDLYNPVKYNIRTSRENKTYPKEDKDQNLRYLGLACNAAKVNAYYVLTQQGRVVNRMHVNPFSVERLPDPAVQNRIKTFDSVIKRHWKIDDEADIHQAPPTFPEFDPNLVP